jgi:hypothetical protein
MFAIGIGALRMARANAVCASILAIFLLPGLLLVLLATARGIYLQEWYLSSMLPGVVGGRGHRNSDRAVEPSTRPRNALGAPSACIALHRRLRSVHRPDTPSSHVPLDGAVPRVCGIDPADTQPQCTRKPRYHYRLVLDVSTDLRPAGTESPHRCRVQDSDARKVSLYVNNGFIAGVKDRYPDIHDFLGNEQYFERVATLHGTEPMFDRTVYRYRSGSLLTEAR